MLFELDRYTAFIFSYSLIFICFLFLLRFAISNNNKGMYYIAGAFALLTAAGASTAITLNHPEHTILTFFSGTLAVSSSFAMGLGLLFFSNLKSHLHKSEALLVATLWVCTIALMYSLHTARPAMWAIFAFSKVVLFGKGIFLAGYIYDKERISSAIVLAIVMALLCGIHILRVSIYFQDGTDRTLHTNLAFHTTWMHLMLTLALCELSYDRSRKRVKHLIDTDPLTQLHNRRSLEKEFKLHSKRYGAVLILDIDHFKHFNDNHGHTAGDAALIHVAKLIAGSVRKNDFVARYGGEEFVVLLENCSIEQSSIVAEKIRDTVASHSFECNGVLIPQTISGGIYTMKNAEHELKDAIDHADTALYNAKETGRNRIVSYKPASRKTT